VPALRAEDSICAAVCHLLLLKNTAAGQHASLLPSLLLPQCLDVLWANYPICSLPFIPFPLLTMKEHMTFVLSLYEFYVHVTQH